MSLGLSIIGQSRKLANVPVPSVQVPVVGARNAGEDVVNNKYYDARKCLGASRLKS